MNRRGPRDVVIAGGGVVGAACALALAQAGLSVALVEAAPPAPWRADAPDLRVYAIAADSAALLDALGAWRAVRDARAQPYRRMRVWDAAGGGELRFDADALGRPELGWIVEHALLVDRLWARLAEAGVDVRCPARVEALERDDARVLLRLDDGGRVEARLAIAADGGASTLRTLAGIGVDGHDHGQHGLVAYVRGERHHEDTAWQRFLPTGPLALLPCRDGIGSIVWTLPSDEAQRLRALDDAAFADALATAFDGRFGAFDILSPRAAFPLRRQLADRQADGRVLVLGDAAHVVHPLAGQGVNLGLRDVAALRDAVVRAQARGRDWASPAGLARWARARRSENVLAAHAFDGINRVFSNDAVAATLLRGPLLGLAGRLPPVASLLWRRASGG